MLVLLLDDTRPSAKATRHDPTEHRNVTPALVLAIIMFIGIAWIVPVIGETRTLTP